MASVINAVLSSSAMAESGAQPNVPVLWDDDARTTPAVDNVAAVAMNARWVAVAGLYFSLTCAPPVKCTGVDASVRVYDAVTGRLQWTNNFDLNVTYDVNDAVAVADDVVLTAGYSVNRLRTSNHAWWVASAFDANTGALLWRDIVGDATNDHAPRQIAVAHGQAYFTGFSGPLCYFGPVCNQYTRAYDVATGQVLWTTESAFLPGGDNETTGVAVDQRRVFIGGLRGLSLTDGTVQPDVKALDAKTGALLWENAIPDPFGDGSVFRVVARDGVVVAGAVASDGWLIRAYDEANGNVLWTQTFYFLGTPMPLVFNVPVQLALRNGVVVAGGYGQSQAYGQERYYRSSRKWVVIAYDAFTGRELWRDVRGAPDDVNEVDAGVVIAGDQAIASGFISEPGQQLCYLLSCAHSLVRSYDLHSGQLRWEDLSELPSFPFGVTVNLATSSGRVTATSHYTGVPSPTSLAGKTRVRTYAVDSSSADDE